MNSIDNDIEILPPSLELLARDYINTLNVIDCYDLDSSNPVQMKEFEKLIAKHDKAKKDLIEFTKAL